MKSTKIHESLREGETTGANPKKTGYRIQTAIEKEKADIASGKPGESRFRGGLKSAEERAARIKQRFVQPSEKEVEKAKAEALPHEIKAFDEPYDDSPGGGLEDVFKPSKHAEKAKEIRKKPFKGKARSPLAKG